MTASRRSLLDGALLQAGWLVCVLGAAHGAPLAGPGFVATVLLARPLLSPRWRGELAGALRAAVPGLAADGLLVATGVLAFPGSGPHLLGLPLWIAALWPLFAATFGTTFAWLGRHRALPVVVGALGGPPGYLAAERLGALQLAGPTLGSVLALALAWGLALPLSFALFRRSP